MRLWDAVGDLQLLRPVLLRLVLAWDTISGKERKRKCVGKHIKVKVIYCRAILRQSHIRSGKKKVRGSLMKWLICSIATLYSGWSLVLWRGKPITGLQWQTKKAIAHWRRQNQCKLTLASETESKALPPGFKRRKIIIIYSFSRFTKSCYCYPHSVCCKKVVHVCSALFRNIQLIKRWERGNTIFVLYTCGR